MTVSGQRLAAAAVGSTAAGISCLDYRHQRESLGKPNPDSKGTLLSGRIINHVQLSPNGIHFLTTSGEIFSIGIGLFGKIGDGHKINRRVPTKVDMDGVLLNKHITKIASGWFHVVVLDSNGLVYGFGTGVFGQLGNNETDIINLYPINVCIR